MYLFKEWKTEKNARGWLLWALASAFMFTVFAPLDAYFSNESEFWFRLTQLLPVVVVCFAASFLILFAIAEVLYRCIGQKKSGWIVFTFFLNILLYFYVQGNFIPRHYGVLNGVSIDFDRHPVYAWASIVLIAGTLVVSLFSIFVIKEKIYAFGRFVCAVLLGLQLVTLCFSYYKKHILNAPVRSEVVVTNRDLLTLGQEENIIFFILDTFDGEDMEDLFFREHYNGYYQEMFEDFTYYQDTTSMYPTTKGALPYLLTGVPYLNQETYADYIRRAYGETDLYDVLAQEGIQVSVYTDNSDFLDPDCAKYTNVEHGRYRIGSNVEFAKEMYSLVAFNYMPHQLKRFFFVDTEDFGALQATAEGDSAFSWDVQDFYNKLTTERLQKGDAAKWMHVYHLAGIHLPYTFDGNLHSEADRIYNVIDEAEGNCTMVGEYLDQLRELGLYDSATIIVTADHGNYGHGQYPIFFVKNAGEHHPFKISSAKNSHANMMKLLKDVAQGKTFDEEAVRACNPEESPRRFYYYSWDDGWEDLYLPEIAEMEQDGIAIEDSALTETGVRYAPAGQKERAPVEGPLSRLLKKCMDWCYRFCGNYGLAILLFTLFSKLVLLPLSVWTHINSITMIRIQPQINFLKARYYGQKDKVGEEQTRIFKEEGYHPLLSTIPMIVQLVLLIGVVAAIRAGIEDPTIDMNWGAVNLGHVPSQTGLRLLWSPLAAAASAWLMSYTQNKSNVLQAEQSKWNQYGMMAFSAGLSLYLGWFVPVGTALYWVASNLLSIVQMYALNAVIPPKKYVDYQQLEESRKALAGLQTVGGRKKEGYFSANRKRERKDYKRFFSVLNKHLVFYSEGSGFYKYFKGYIEYILKYTDLTIHYITSDPKDAIFAKAEEEPKLRAYYIGENKLITLMMKLEADVVVMTMPDLEHFHIKRSYLRQDMKYIYVQHNIGSNNLTMRKMCMEYFDIVFCADKLQKEEEQAIEEKYDLRKKVLAEVGYPLLDDMRAAYRAGTHEKHTRKQILIAPSWQADNIVDSCLEEMLAELSRGDYDVTVRPHPQEVRLKAEYMQQLKEKYESEHVHIQTDFSSNNTVMEADLLITDWSGIAWEYAFTTGRPVLYVDTPMKIMNEDYKEIDIEPFDIRLRDMIGKRLNPDQMKEIRALAEDLLAHSAEYQEHTEALVQEYICHPDHAAAVGGDVIVSEVLAQIARRKEAQAG